MRKSGSNWCVYTATAIAVRFVYIDSNDCRCSNIFGVITTEQQASQWVSLGTVL